MQKQQTLSAKELIELSAADPEFYGRTFFPMTMRQPSPPFHRDIFDLVDDREHRYVAIEVFRGGAKTSLLRVAMSKRIAFGISRLIAIVGSSQDHAKQSLRWLRRAVEWNKLWTQTFGISKGGVWHDEALEIEHRTMGFTITVLAVGITGKIRGINVNDYRPDLILLDDPCDEENTATLEQRLKTEALVFGALAKSLAPASESPDAKMVLLQTPLNKEDLISKAQEDPSWAARRYGCFDENGKSRWEERYPTEVLLREKQEHADRQQMLLWLREMECVVVGGEAAIFRAEWLRSWDVLPERLVTYLAIDPVPPPTDRQIAIGSNRGDFEALVVVGRHRQDYYVLETVTMRGHTPEWTVTQFFRLIDKWRPLRAVVESVAYQRTLKWLLEQEMIKRGRFIQLDSTPNDRRSKVHRITQALSGIASQGRLYAHPTQVELYEQFSTFPLSTHDDVLDATAMAVTLALQDSAYDFENLPYDEADLEPLGAWRCAP